MAENKAYGRVAFGGKIADRRAGREAERRNPKLFRGSPEIDSGNISASTVSAPATDFASELSPRLGKDPITDLTKTALGQKMGLRLGGLVARSDAPRFQGPDIAGVPLNGLRPTLPSVSDSLPPAPRLFGSVSDDGLAPQNTAQKWTKFGKATTEWEMPNKPRMSAAANRYAPQQGRMALGGQKKRLPY